MSPSWLNVSEPQKAAIIELISLIKDMNLLSGLMAVPERSQIEKYQQWTSGLTDDPALNEIMLYRQQGYAGTTYEQLSEGIRVWLDAAIPFTIATDQGPEAADLGPTVWGRLGRAHFDRMIGLQDAGASYGHPYRRNPKWRSRLSSGRQERHDRGWKDGRPSHC